MINKLNRRRNLNKPLFPAVLAAILAGCSGEPQDQVVADFGIAYIKRPVVTAVNGDGDTVLVNTDLRRLTTFNAGGDVWFRDRAAPSASERNITLCITDIDDDGVGDGDVRDLEASYDGTKLIFSLRVDPDPDDDVDPTWNIYEYDVAAGGCPERVIGTDLTAEEGEDVAPHYLPDGRIVFSTTRQTLTREVLVNEGKQQFPPLDEDQREPAFVLHVMSATGGDIQQISFNQSHDLDPAVLMSGEIVFSRWDHMGERNNINLYTVRPDGTELKALYGVHSHAAGTGGSTVQYVAPRELSDGKILAMLKPFTAIANGGAPVIIDAANYADVDQPTWPNQGVLSGEGHVSAVNSDVRTDGSISRAGRFRSVYPLWDGTNRALVSWSQCRLQASTTVNGVTTITNTPCPKDIAADAVESFPIYGIYVYDLGNNTSLPVVLPREGIIVEEPVVLAPRDRPAILNDKTVFDELDVAYENEKVGLLHIRSVYDRDGVFYALGTTGITDLASMANTSADIRPARFLRIVKAASIPGDDDHDFDNSAFGVSRAQKMREIIGYAPIEPDGSVLVKVPANVPLAISVVDKDGRRLNGGGRHQNWIQVKPGETLECNGCHNHTTTGALPHGQKDAPASINLGALIEPQVFLSPVADPPVLFEMGETMAQTRIRVACGTGKTRSRCPALSPSVDLLFDDVWTDPDTATPTASVYLRYADLLTDAPATADVTPSCLPIWKAECRVIINYETHIHPLWSLARMDPSNPDPANTDWTCTNASCHDSSNSTSQLDLTDGASSDEPDHFRAYRELLVNDVIKDAAGVPVEFPVVDADNNPVYVPLTDADGNPVLDENGNPVFATDSMGNLIQQTEQRGVTASMSVNGSRFGTFIGKVDGSDAGHPSLSAAELRLISEWLDIGAQYYNNPFCVDAAGMNLCVPN